MHNLTKIKIFRVVCWVTYPLALIFLYPLALLKKKNKSGLFFFFDRYSIGGAQKIHLDILASVQDIQKQVYFTRLSVNKTLKPNFYSLPNSVCRDIHFWCDYLIFRPFTVHYYAFYLNRHANPVVFSSNSTFFYDLLPFLNKQVITYELLHNFTFGKKGMEFFGLANYRRITSRFVYDTYTLSNIEKQYREYHIEKTYLDRLVFIEPGVELSGSYHKNFGLPIKILYAGRGGAQKRINLLNTIAEHIIDEKLPVQFHFAGTAIAELSDKVKTNSVLHGEIGDPKEMNQLYANSHILLMTSAYEGFPMFIKEGMANGCVPVVTALEGNKMHLKDGENALLINAVTNEKEVVEKGIQRLTQIAGNLALLEQLSHNAYTYACAHFSKERFFKEYRKYLLRD
jgi:glycosyltransferase involved in cell wall biosynthesis